MTMQNKSKSHDGFEFYRQAEKQRIDALQSKLILEAESRVITHFTGRYGPTKLVKASKPTLTIRAGANGQPVCDGQIEVFMEVSAGAAAKRMSTAVNVVHNTTSMPKYKYVDKIVADTKTEGELQAALGTTSLSTEKALEVDLSLFKAADSGPVLEIFHPVYGEGSLGKLTKEEYTTSDKQPLISIGTTGTFAANHPKGVFAGKAFKVTDSDGDMVQLQVGKVSGWLACKDLVQDIQNAASPTKDLALGDRVAITEVLKEYYGDTVIASDLVGKKATIARMADKNFILSVDNLAEEVSLGADVLQSLETTPQTKIVPKLEALLRDMVVDRFKDKVASIRFVGKFKTPELPETPKALEASVDKKVATEETPMAPNELELKFTRASGFDQFMNFQMQKIASQKQTLVERAASTLAALLNKSYSPTRVLSTSSNLEYAHEKGHSGDISVQAEVVDKQGSKQITVNMKVAEDKVEMPKEADVAELVAKAISEKDKLQAKFDKEANDKIAQIDAEVAHDAAQVRAAFEGPKGPTGKPQPKVEKTAAGSMQPQESQIQPVFKINRHFLPASLQEGAVVDLGDGVRYKLISKHDGTQLDKNADGGNFWTFERVWAQSEERPQYRVTNY